MELELKIKKIEKATNFIRVVAELDGQIYEGVLIGKGGIKDEERTQDMVNS